MADSYTWATTNSGDWSNASNWFDVTTGTPAIAAPGPADTAEIDNAGTGTITVTGPADVSGLSVSGNVTLAGNFSTGTGVLGVPPFNPSFLGPTFTSTITLAGTFVASSLAIGDLHLVPGFASFPVADYGLIEVDQGAMLSAGSVTLNSGDLQVNGGAVSISNDLTLGVDLFPQPSGLVADVTSGSLTVTNHGSVQLGGLAITDGSVSLDATSTLEIGGAGTATTGTITVDPGAVLTEGDGLSHVAKVVHDAETVDISAPVLNNGVINSDQNLSDVINNGTINADNDALSFISGNGVVNLGHEGTIGSGDSGTFDIAFGDTIVLALGTGVPIDVTDTPLIADFATSNTLETIVLQGISADTATYTATGLGIGTLTLDRGLTQVASLTMLGTYDSDSFVVVPQSGNSILTLNTVAPPASFTWATSGSGAWSNAANWFDVTTGLPASAPPGLLDTAEIDNPNPGTITVTGPANIASLSVNGDVTLAGGFAIGSMMLGVPPGGTGSPQPGVTTQTIALAGDFAASTVTIGSLLPVSGSPSEQSVDDAVVALDQGAVLSAGTVQLTAGDLQVDGGTVSIGNGLTLGAILTGVSGQSTPALTGGSLEVTNHGSARFGTLAIIDGSVSLDATSTLEIGDAGTAAAGTITVDSGASILDGNWDGPAFSTQTYGTVVISAPILNNGVIYTDHDLSDVVNNGIIYSDHGATLSFISGNGVFSVGVGGTIGPGVSGRIDFFSEDTIVFALGAGIPIDTSDTPQISQFGVGGDTYATIILQGITADSATYAATGTGIGTLTLDDGTTPVASLTMLGSYASDAFTVVPGSGGSLLTAHTPTPPPACFAAGTRVATPRGEVAVEALSPGDEVTLASGATAPIVWIGRRRVDCRSHPKPQDVWPVRIRRGAFAPGAPHRDLFLSPDHAVFIEDVLIPIKYLMNGETIRQIERKAVEYFHLELPAHDVVLADGLAVESYLDTGDRASFENAGRVVSLFPTFSSLAWEAYGYAPLVVTGPAVKAARRRIEIQARNRDPAPQRRRCGAAWSPWLGASRSRPALN